MDPFNRQQGGQSPDQQQQINPAQYQFSAEELRVLKECNVESFYQRSLPFGTALGLAAWAAVKKGMLKGSPKYGPIPKVALGVVVGYFAGKFSYQGQCAEKIMRLPNSQLGEMLRKRRKGGFSEGFSMNPSGGSFGLSPNAQMEQPADHQHDRANSSLDIDISRPSMGGLNDSFRGNVDSAMTTFDDNLPADPPKMGTSYDELRRANRDDYQRRMNQPSQARPAQPPMQYQPPPQQQEEPVGRPAAKNKYGDVWT